MAETKDAGATERGACVCHVPASVPVCGWARGVCAVHDALCHECGGFGEVETPDDDFEVCPRCDGTGQEPRR